MKNKKLLFIGTLLVVLMLISSCDKAATSPNMDATMAVNVAVAQTAAVLQTEAAQTISAFEQLHPTVTSTPTSTATLESTATPEKFTITLSRDTYCRTGTSSQFPSVMYVTAGTTLEVLARNPTNDSYYVKDPNHNNSYCWIWGEYATASGDQKILPMYTSKPLPTNTPTPTPAPDFTVEYLNLGNCGGNDYLNFVIRNPSKFTWQYIQINLYDNTTTLSTVHTSTSFTSYSGCTAGISQGDLAPGEDGEVAAINTGQFPAPITGHSISVTVTLCQTDSGGCISKSLTVTP